MQEAIKEAKKGISHGHGGPFGAVIVKNGKIIAKGHNHVIANNDPTCHGEIDAIRKAGRKLKTFDLRGCDIYTTGYPCPMCFCAILWANIDHVYYGCDVKEAETIGFRDQAFEKSIPEQKLKLCQEIDHDACLELYQKYQKTKHQLY